MTFPPENIAGLTPAFHLKVLEDSLTLLADAVADARAATVLHDSPGSFAIREAPLALTDAAESLAALRRAMGLK